MADVVLALQWVKENIEVFGGESGECYAVGNPAAVGKNVTLMQMPPADGLYHKVITYKAEHYGIVRKNKYYRGKKDIGRVWGKKQRKYSG